MSDSSDLLGKMRQAILDGDSSLAEQLAQQGIDSDLPPLTAIEQGFVIGIREAGALWEEGEYFLPELVTAAQAMTAAMAVLRPTLGGKEGEHQAGRVVIGTVQGDIHDIGKTLVATLLSANGFTVSDEGADVSVERFVERAGELDADVVCASALLTTTMTVQAELVTALKEAGCRAKVMVGGAPVTRQWADQVGAEGFADSAMAAVKEARRLLEGQ